VRVTFGIDEFCENNLAVSYRYLCAMSDIARPEVAPPLSGEVSAPSWTRPEVDNGQLIASPNDMTMSLGRSRAWCWWVTAPLLVTSIAAMSRYSDPVVALHVVVLALAPIALAFAAISAGSSRAKPLARFAALTPFAVAAMVFDPASSVLIGLSEIRPGRDTVQLGLQPHDWHGVGRGPLATVLLVVAVLVMIWTPSWWLRVSGCALLVSAVGATLLLPWNYGPSHPMSQTAMVCGAALSLGSTAMHNGARWRGVGVLASAGVIALTVYLNHVVEAFWDSMWSEIGGRVLIVALAVAVLAAWLVSTDHSLSESNDDLIGEPMTSSLGALGCAFAGFIGAYVLWNLERKRFPRPVTDFVIMQHVSIVVCTVGLGCALAGSVFLIPGLLIAAFAGLFAALIGLFYIGASVLYPFSAFVSVKVPPDNATWLWARQSSFVQVVQVLTFVIIHFFMVTVTGGLWLVPPAFAWATLVLVTRSRLARDATRTVKQIDGLDGVTQRS
jgi:hypothetical protein